MAKTIRCPSCNSNIELEEDMKIGDVIYCTECYQELKLISLNPPKVEEIENSYDGYDDREEEGEEW